MGRAPLLWVCAKVSQCSMPSSWGRRPSRAEVRPPPPPPPPRRAPPPPARAENHASLRGSSLFQRLDCYLLLPAAIGKQQRSFHLLIVFDTSSRHLFWAFIRWQEAYLLIGQISLATDPDRLMDMPEDSSRVTRAVIQSTKSLAKGSTFIFLVISESHVSFYQLIQWGSLLDEVRDCSNTILLRLDDGIGTDIEVLELGFNLDWCLAVRGILDAVELCTKSFGVIRDACFKL